LNNTGVFDKFGKLAYNSDLESLKTSVSNGKILIANAITDKGVATSSSDTFATMASNIESIVSVPSGTTLMLNETFSLTNSATKKYTINHAHYAMLYYVSNGGGGAGYAYALYLYNTTGTELNDWDYANGSRTACQSLLPSMSNGVLTCDTGNYTEAVVTFYLVAW